MGQKRRKTIIELYDCARKKAVLSGYPQLSEDFASWYLIRHLEGRALNQTLAFALIDFIREEYGDLRAKQRREKPLGINFDGLLGDDLSPEDKALVFDFIKKFVTPQEEKIFYLYFCEGYYCREIGDMFGVSEAYVSVRIKEIIARFKRERFLRGKISYY